MLSAARPIVDPPGPQFSGQEIQTFTNDVINPICSMPEVSYNLVGDGIFLVCFVELVDEPVCKLEFPELDAKVEYFAFTDDFYRPPASNTSKAGFSDNKQHSNYGYPFSANRFMFS